MAGIIKIIKISELNPFKINKINTNKVNKSNCKLIPSNIFIELVNNANAKTKNKSEYFNS